MASETANRLTFEDGTTKAFDGIELGKPDQIKVYKTCPQYQGVNVARVLQRPGDLWAGKYVRCLCAKYDTNERDGQTYRWVVSTSLPSNFGSYGNNLLWELHHRSNLYNLQNLGVAPIAIDSNGGKWSGRVQAGKGTIGLGYASRVHTDFAQIVYDKRVDFGIEVAFGEGSGHFYIWYNPSGTPDPDMFSKAPVWKYDGPTLPYATNGAHVGSAGLYQELGIYSGKSSVGETDALDLFGSIRRPGSDDMKQAITSIGTPGQAPDPGTPPAGSGTVHCNIQANDSVEAKVQDVTTTVTGAVKAVQYYLDGAKHSLSGTAPDFKTQVDFTGMSGAHTFGVAGLDGSGNEVTGAVFKEYPIKVVAPAPTPNHLNTKVDRQRGIAWLNWDKVDGAIGYKLYTDGVSVSTAGPGAISARFEFGPGDHLLEVEALPASLGIREGKTVKQSVV